MKKIILIVSIVSLLCLPAFSADFLTSARGSGIGFSFFVLGDDPSGALYNPASLGYIAGWQSQLMYNKRNNYGYLQSGENPYYGLWGVVFNKPEWGSFSLNGMQTGSFFETTSIPTVNYLAVSFGREFSPGLSFGTSMKYLSEYGFLERSAFDFDLGATYRSNEGIILAIAGENIARSELTPARLGISEKLPRRGRLGGAYIMDSEIFQAAFLLAGQIEESGITEKYTTSLFNLGSEWWFNRFNKVSFGARMGYTFGKGVYKNVKSDFTGPAAGFSVNFKTGTNNFRLDYSWEAFPYNTTDGSAPSNHYIAFNFGWGGVPEYKSYKYDEEYIENLPAEPETFNPPSRKEKFANKIDRDTNFETRKYERYQVNMDVTDISSLDFKRIVFYMRPQQILTTIRWKLYVFKAKIKNWNDIEIDRWALKIIGGKGLPPINVVWDGISTDGRMLPPGKYYYILTAEGKFGQSFATKWHSFKLE